MRLSPKSTFFGLLVLGLPVSMTIGWQLATPVTRSTAVDLPGGAERMGGPFLRDGSPVAASPTVLLQSGWGQTRTSSTRWPSGRAVTVPKVALSASPSPRPVGPVSPLTAPPVPTPHEISTPPGTPPAPSPTTPSAGPTPTAPVEDDL